MIVDAYCAEQLFSERKWQNGETLVVCGVFSSAIYLQDRTGNLCLLHDCQHGLLPFGFGINQIADVISKIPVKTGEKAVLENNRITFEAVDMTVRFVVIKTPGKEPIALNKTLLISAANSGAVYLREGKTSFSAYFSEETDVCNHDAFRRMFTKQIKEKLPMLKSALKDGKKENLTAVVNSLLGLGIGLTPTMDDFFVGLIYTFRYAQKYWGFCIPEANVLSTIITETAPKQTSLFSIPYLSAAAKGLPFSILDDVLLSVSSGLLSEKAVRRLLRVGHSSGSDMLMGIVFGLEHLCSM